LKFILLCLAAAAVPAIGENRAQPTPRITLYARFEQEPPPAVMEGLQQELEAIMDPIGLHFEWRSLNVASFEVSAELAVVTVRGRCDTAGITYRSKAEGALGFTHISDGQILPFTELNCDRLRHFVQSELMLMHPREREAAYGRALGRVLAHELYHVFANTTRHGTGVAKEAYTVRDLTCDDFQFQHRESEMLRANRIRMPIEAPALTPVAGIPALAPAGQ